MKPFPIWFNLLFARAWICFSYFLIWISCICSANVFFFECALARVCDPNDAIILYAHFVFFLWEMTRTKYNTIWIFECSVFLFPPHIIIIIISERKNVQTINRINFVFFRLQPFTHLLTHTTYTHRLRTPTYRRYICIKLFKNEMKWINENKRKHMWRKLIILLLLYVKWWQENMLRCSSESSNKYYDLKFTSTNKNWKKGKKFTFFKKMNKTKKKHLFQNKISTRLFF